MPEDDHKYLRDCYVEFESLGEEVVQMKHQNPHSWTNERYKHGAAEAWLKAKEDERALTASERRDAREEETLAIARASNDLAREANDVARSASSFAERASVAADEANAVARESNAISRESVKASRLEARAAKYAALIAAIAAITANRADMWGSDG